MFEVMRVAYERGRSGSASMSWATHVLLEQLQQVSQRYGAGGLPLVDSNRYALALLQHLMQVRVRRRWVRLGPIPPAVVRQLDLRRHVLPGISLSRMTFIACEFDDCDLSQSKFVRSEFRGCSFRRANLALADFRASRIVGCNFEEATMDSAKGLG